MTFRGASFERESRGGLRPVASPINHLVVCKIMPRRLPVNRCGLEFRVVPDERPEIFGIELLAACKPVGYALRLSILKARSEAIEQIVIAIKPPVFMGSLVIFAFASARQRAFKNI